MEHSAPKIIVGLGNPGAEFEETYHNAGVLALGKIAATLGIASEDWKVHKKLFSYAKAANLVLVRPLTFMNESGIATKEALKKFGGQADKLIVLHDESDLLIGSFKISEGKNAAGHRGVQSIIDQIGTNEFERIRIGIRPEKEAKRKKASDFVLAKITTADRKKLEKVFEEIAQTLKFGIQR
jgi:PTH1 family peptidyl-tRNA hydrolase